MITGRGNFTHAKECQASKPYHGHTGFALSAIGKPIYRNFFEALLEGSGFAAVAFLPLAWLWPWIISPAKLSRRILNIFLLLAWCPFFIAVVHVFASWDIGVMWWIFILSVASGLFSYKAVFVFLWAASLLLAMFPLAWGNGRKTLNQQALK